MGFPLPFSDEEPFTDSGRDPAGEWPFCAFISLPCLNKELPKSSGGEVAPWTVCRPVDGGFWGVALPRAAGRGGIVPDDPAETGEPNVGRGPGC